MSIELNSNYKSSLELYQIGKNLDFLVDLYQSKKLPKILMLSGKKGIGKFTLVYHFMNFLFDNENYDLVNKKINKDSPFNKQYMENTFPNIIYLPGDNFRNVKIQDIRNLKAQLLKTTILDKERFIILDDIELFNVNSLNSLLKIIEEPSEKNFFILINNKTKSLIETIYSRSIEIKINLNNVMRKKTIESLINNNGIDVLIDYEHASITPGNFLLFNEIVNLNNIDINDELLVNIEKILTLYKKSKDINLINLSLLLTDYYFQNVNIKKNKNLENNINDRNFIVNNINKFVTYNLNQNSLINALSEKLSNE